MSPRVPFVRRSLALLVVAFSWMTACQAPAPPNPSGDGDGDGDTSTDPTSGDSAIDPTTGSNTSGPLDTTTGGPPKVTCANGIREMGEACDDGNDVSGDGCPSNCLSIEEGFICPEEGQPCRPFALCGDGKVVVPEQCDDGNLDSNDGCSDICQVEIGYKCSVADDGTGTQCDETTCGDGKQEGAETCDDGNTMPFDGCSPICQAEPKCEAGKGCTSSCGDGVVVAPEECDDGNSINGDGCSSDCVVEDGYSCEQPNDCTMIGDECVLHLPIIYRDFSKTHSDFGVSCDNPDGLPGMVELMLAGGKPVLATDGNTQACVASKASFTQWYTDVAPTNATVPDEIVLFETEAGSGIYSNRLNNEGDRYMVPAPDAIQWCSDVSGECNKCAPGYTVCHETCTPWGADNTQTCAEYDPDNPIYLDGNPLFFPIDGRGLPDSASEEEAAGIPQEVYSGGWKMEPGGETHNFHFTSEIAYWFQYDTGDVMNLTFVGDDDVWVFVNGHLAVDLGGLHVPVQGSFAVAADGTITTVSSDQPPVVSDLSDYGIEDGQVYEIKVFQAERKVIGSSYKLSLSGFNAARSVCRGTCGDGILTAGEMCDDGEDNSAEGETAHNQCAHDCTLGTYCGDGIKQEEEECDDNDVTDPNRKDCRGCEYIILH